MQKVDITQKIIERYLEEELQLSPEEEMEVEQRTMEAIADPIQYEQTKKRVADLLEKRDLSSRQNNVVSFRPKGRKLADVERAAAKSKESDPLAKSRIDGDALFKFDRTDESDAYKITISKVDKDNKDPISLFSGMDDGEIGLQFWMDSELLFELDVILSRQGRLAEGNTHLMIPFEKLKQLEENDISLYLY